GVGALLAEAGHDAHQLRELDTGHLVPPALLEQGGPQQLGGEEGEVGERAVGADRRRAAPLQPAHAQRLRDPLLDPAADVPPEAPFDVAGGLVDAVVRVVPTQPRGLQGAVRFVEVARGVGEQVAQRRPGRAGRVLELRAPLLQGEGRAESGEGLGDRSPGADPLDVPAPRPLPLRAEHDRGGLEPEVVEEVEAAHRAPGPKRSSSASVSPGQTRTCSGPKGCSPRKTAVREATGSTHRKEPDWPKWPNVSGEEALPVQWGSLWSRISKPSPQSLGFWRP